MVASLPHFSLEYKQKPTESIVCKRKHNKGTQGIGDRGVFSTASLREIMVV